MAMIPVAKLGCKLNIGDPSIVVFEGDVVKGLAYRSGTEIKTIDGTIRVIHATTKANSASPAECPPEPYVQRYITPVAFVIDSSEQYDAELNRINISDIISIAEVNGTGNSATVDGQTYGSVGEAVTAAADGATVVVTQDALVDGGLDINGITLDGNGKTLMFKNEDGSVASDPALILAANKTGVVIKNLGVNTMDLIRHAIQLYLGDGAVIDGVEINAGPYTGILVNGSTNVTVKNTKITLRKSAYTNIEFAMGSAVTTVPSITIENVTFDDSKPYIWADAATFNRVRAFLGEGTSDDGVLEYIKSCITNKNAKSIRMYVGMPDGTTKTIIIPVEK